MECFLFLEKPALNIHFIGSYLYLFAKVEPLVCLDFAFGFLG